MLEIELRTKRGERKKIRRALYDYQRDVTRYVAVPLVGLFLANCLVRNALWLGFGILLQSDSPE